jgi:hypothetical protein
VTTTLETTQHHPFWDATDGRWVDAGELKPGHRLLAHDDKRLEGDGSGAGSGGGGPPVEVTVVEVVNVAGGELVHDLTVADIHTYHVVAGTEPVLVHNNNPVYDHCGPIGPVEPNGRRAGWTERPEDPAPRYHRRTQYTNMSSGDRSAALADNPIERYTIRRCSTMRGLGHPART